MVGRTMSDRVTAGTDPPTPFERRSSMGRGSEIVPRRYFLGRNPGRRSPGRRRLPPANEETEEQRRRRRRGAHHVGAPAHGAKDGLDDIAKSSSKRLTTIAEGPVVARPEVEAPHHVSSKRPVRAETPSSVIVLSTPSGHDHDRPSDDGEDHAHENGVAEDRADALPCGVQSPEG